jgi:hypothetical protein
MKRGALETVGSPGMDRAAGDEKRAKAGASTATATPHRGTLLAGAGEEQENLDPAGPIRERIASETGDPARADSDGADAADDDEAVPDSQVTLGVSSEGDHHLGSVMGTQPAPSPSGSHEDEDDEDVHAGVMPTQPAPMQGDSETAKLRDRVLAETGRRLSAGWRASVETSKKKKRVRFFSPDGKRFGCAKDVVTFVETDNTPGAVGDETVTTRNLDAAMEDAVEGTGGGDASAEGRTLEKEEEKEDAEDDDEDVDVAPTQAAPPTEDDDEEEEEEGDFEMFAPTQPAPMPEDINEEGHGDLVAPTPVDPSDASGDGDTSPPAPLSPDDGLTAFERERRANIARNERVMAALNIPVGAMSDKTRDAFEPKAPTETAPTETAPETPEPPAEEPPVVVVDARPGDAAARFLRRRLLASSGDAAPSSEALEFCPELRDHQRHLVDILSDTITGGQNNSVLLVGARGAGKTLVLDSALRQLRETHGTGVLPVRLNGMLHSDERVGMRVSFSLFPFVRAI